MTECSEVYHDDLCQKCFWDINETGICGCDIFPEEINAGG